MCNANEITIQRREPHYFNFAIKYNNAAINSICPICRERTDPNFGAQVFYNDDILCDDCTVVMPHEELVEVLVATNEKIKAYADYYEKNPDARKSFHEKAIKTFSVHYEE